MKIPPRQAMHHLDPKKRIHSFDEVTIGYTEEEAVKEAQRCIQCKNKPCTLGCPVEVDIPEFIDFIAQKKFPEAIKSMRKDNNLPAVCGRVCPQEKQCEKVCTLAKKCESVACGYLERFIADWEMANRPIPSGQRIIDNNGQEKARIKVAVAGAGPAGLSCAGDLAKMGYTVTLFESLHATGGVLRYGIPEFRLPKKILDYETAYIKRLGVDVVLNALVGKTITIEELFNDGYKALFLGVGAGLPQFLGIKGENLNGVYSANEFLTRTNLMHGYEFPKYDTPVKIGKRVAVIGGGDTAMDSSRCSLRLGAEKVTLIYRRSREEMPARFEEVENAKEEGVEIQFLKAPIEILDDGKGWVKGMKSINMQLGAPDEEGRRRPTPIQGSEHIIDVDTVVIAIGQSPNPLVPKSEQRLKIDRAGHVIINEKCMSNMKGVFAGGDIIDGSGTAVGAMGDGKRAARAIDEYVKVMVHGKEKKNA